MPLAEVEVEVAVAVEVRQGDGAPHVLGEVELARHAVEVSEVDSEFGGAVDEGRKRVVCGDKGRCEEAQQQRHVRVGHG